MKGRIFFGSTVVLVGVVLLLMALDAIPMDGIGELLPYIPSLFILWGVYLVVAQKFKRASGPIALIAIASVVQLMLLDVLRWAYVWPIAIILVGVSIIAGATGTYGKRKRRRDRRRQRERRHPSTESSIGSETRVNDEGHLDISVTVGEATEYNRSKDFRGGEISCLTGSVKVDLTQAEVEERPARIHVNLAIGEVEILVPDHWIVQHDISKTVGEVEDRTVGPQATEIDENVDLIISGSVAIGQVTIASASRAVAE